MPKEIIGRPLEPEVVVTDSTDGPRSEAIFDIGVEVAWGRAGSVQVASVNYAREPYTPERGWFTELNRDAVNHLIRTLRKARDQAFGADA